MQFFAPEIYTDYRGRLVSEPHARGSVRFCVPGLAPINLFLCLEWTPEAEATDCDRGGEGGPERIVSLGGWKM